MWQTVSALTFHRGRRAASGIERDSITREYIEYIGDISPSLAASGDKILLSNLLLKTYCLKQVLDGLAANGDNAGVVSVSPEAAMVEPLDHLHIWRWWQP
jgi:hypothetical protein